MKMKSKPIATSRPEGGKAAMSFNERIKKGGDLVSRNKKWIIIGVLMAALVILISAVGGIAYAQTGTSTTDNTTAVDAGNTIYAKVAAILGIDQQKLEDAFAQAQQEMRTEELTNQLNNMVEQGAITQSQADEYLKWWQARPSIVDGLGFGGGQGISGGPRGMGPGGNQMLPPSNTTTN
jgi:hypothetical protein